MVCSFCSTYTINCWLTFLIIWVNDFHVCSVTWNVVCTSTVYYCQIATNVVHCLNSFIVHNHPKCCHKLRIAASNAFTVIPRIQTQMSQSNTIYKKFQCIITVGSATFKVHKVTILCCLISGVFYELTLSKVPYRQNSGHNICIKVCRLSVVKMGMGRFTNSPLSRNRMTMFTATTNVRSDTCKPICE